MLCHSEAHSPPTAVRPVVAKSTGFSGLEPVECASGWGLIEDDLDTADTAGFLLSSLSRDPAEAFVSRCVLSVNVAATSLVTRFLDWSNVSSINPRKLFRGVSHYPGVVPGLISLSYWGGVAAPSIPMSCIPGGLPVGAITAPSWINSLTTEVVTRHKLLVPHRRGGFLLATTEC